MNSKPFYYWYLDNKDNIFDSEFNDYQVQSPNFLFFTPQIYKNQNHNDTTTEQGLFQIDSELLQNSLLLNNISFKKDFDNSQNIKQTNTTIEEKIKDAKKIDNNYSLEINNPSIPKVINPSEKLKDELFLGKKYGRKKKNDISKRAHNKYSNDNIRRKIKHLVLKSFVSFFNEKIKKIYKEDIGQNILKKKLLPLNKEVKFNTSVKFNQILLKRTLKDIYSDNITTRFINFPKSHNINLIQKLVNEEDEEKRSYFINLFNLTFLDCLNHYRGTYFIKELNGMKCFNEIQNEFDDDQEYKTILKYHINNFDKIIKEIKSRKTKQKNGETI